ncbi:hypothetical protein GCM10009786_12780 [Leucobacter alluvii]|uniref:Alpha-tubulin suppressor-like RCC1 family protein n=1 Tax=Leucobacter alluvii TaxID=340321 RepID=A0ABN3B5J3_9MICO
MRGAAAPASVHGQEAKQVGSRRGIVGAAIASAAALGVLAFTASTTVAGFQSSSYARAELATEAMISAYPVRQDMSPGSALYLNRFGELYVSGDRRSGNGAGTASTALNLTPPNQVVFPEGVRIVDAGSSGNDFNWGQQTLFSALDDQGRVWTWGQAWGGHTLIGRGPISASESWTPGQVTTTDTGEALPEIIDLQQIENQVYALDVSGTLWAWGYGGENMPTPTTGNKPLPSRANTTTATPGLAACVSNNTGDVVWHTIWGGYVSAGGVATNGLIYTWGWDNSNGVSTTQTNQGCPILNQGANEVLFERYPELYQTADGLTYDPSALPTEAERTARYEAIVEHQSEVTTGPCAQPTRKENGVDASECPVRQLGFSSRAPRLLLQNGDLYTWMVSTDMTYGFYFLGRPSSTNQADPNFRNRPALALSNVDSTVSGVGSMQALTRDGLVYGWGLNNFCQAVGERTSGSNPCNSNVAADIVTLPRLVGGIPGDVPIARLSSTQCAAWATSADGAVWGWGGGTIVATGWVTCGTAGATYKIHDQRAATVSTPFGAPITATSTATTPVLE